MDRERWVIKTNQGRYVSIPFILSSGFKSFLDEKAVWNKTSSYDTEEEAQKALDRYQALNSPYHIDRWSFKEGEKLIGVEKVLI
ncbi:hypothetical protein MARVELLAND_125 [Bacillus phage vB_BspM_MarvelLand]|nr:hypothetical protein MARVELLAND_125 [Bacillus phage vB_BspM_MarvelLand]